MPDFVKFLPHEYIVISDQNNFKEIKNLLINEGLNEEEIISLADYKKKLGIVKNIYCMLCFVPSMLGRVNQYFNRNGFRTTVNKIKQRLKK